jgi:hypothetical protein
MRTRYIGISVLAIVAVCLLGAFIYNLPSVHERLSWRVANWRAQIYYAFNPPEKVVFIPQEGQEQVEAIVEATLAALLPTDTHTPAPTITPTATQLGSTSTPVPSLTPTLIPTPIPEKATLSGLTHEYQKMNNCGPATLSTLLSFWGWQGDQRDTRAYLRPNFDTVDDKNVNPPELAGFVEAQTELKALVRVGGELETIKRLIAAGFPVIVEKGFQPPKEDWMGHYQVINGYDDEAGRFLTQDSYIMADFPLPYEQLEQSWWRDFNYVYLVAYPPEREAEVLGILGAHADQEANFKLAAEKAMEETATLSGRDLYFAWFNLGSSRVALQEYLSAAEAYDQAFSLYASLPESERPWRVLWYQTGPYEAY